MSRIAKSPVRLVFGEAMYLRCTLIPQICAFDPFCQLKESITYAFSTTSLVRLPPGNFLEPDIWGVSRMPESLGSTLDYSRIWRNQSILKCAAFNGRVTCNSRESFGVIPRTSHGCAIASPYRLGPTSPPTITPTAKGPFP